MPANKVFERRIIPVQQDCPARLVPSGTDIVIPKDSFVTLTQSLGGSYTVIINGNMARIDGLDAEAIGMKPLNIEYATDGSGEINEDDLWATLHTIYDPEIPVNLVDLGLIYKCQIEAEQGQKVVSVEMTLTAPGCGMGPVLVADVEHRLKRVPNVDQVRVKLVFDPPWDRTMMSEVAQLELGMF